MNNTNDNPAIYINEYNLSTLTEVIKARTTTEDYQHQSSGSTIDTVTKTTMTTDYDLQMASPTPNNNNYYYLTHKISLKADLLYIICNVQKNSNFQTLIKKTFKIRVERVY